MTRRATTERATLTGVAGAVLGLHLLGVGLLLTQGAAHAGLVGAAVLAYTLGVRHGFDADHIAAIDNTTRRLRADGDRSVTVGFFFALGHSSVVLALTLVVAFAAGGVPELGEATGSIAGTASGTFLWVIGLLNLVVLIDIVRVAQRMRAGRLDERAAQPGLVPRGILARLGLGRLMRGVGRPWQMFPLGLLFGLGFETATEVAVLGLGAGATASGLPLLAVLAVPILFAAGMTAVDTADGVVMGRAYDWAEHRPARKLLYNFTITLLSIAMALGIGTLQLTSVAVSELDLHGGVWDWAGEVELQSLGYVLAAALVATWLGAMAAWRLLRLDDRPAQERTVHLMEEATT